MVLFGPMAVFHAGLAGRDPGPAHLLPDQRARHRLRHPVLLGRADDDVRPVRDAGQAAGRRRPVPRRGPARPRPRPVGQEDVKSRGNTVDPLDWIDRFGADATRFTLARGANPGSDIAISEEWAAGSRNFCNKLWNAVRFALLNGAHVPASAPAPAPPINSTSHTDYSVPDRWILSRLSAVIAETDQLFEAFEFGKVCDVLYHFAWDEVFDWYLELAKVPLASDASGAAETTRQVLGFVLDQLLRLLHPVMPFVTEELWTALTGEESVVVSAWPAFSYQDLAAEAEISSLMRLVTEIRRFRSDQGLRPSQRVAARLTGIE